MNGYIKIYDISRHEPQLLTPSKCAYDLFPNFGEVIYAKANIKGIYLAMTIANENLIPDRSLYIWDIERDRIMCFDFFQKEKNIAK